LRKKILFGLTAAVLLAGCGGEMEDSNSESNQNVSLNQDFQEAAVHDPSIIYADDHYYVIGSHLAFAKSPDLMNWEQLSTSVSSSNLFKDVNVSLAESFDYSRTDTLWASDITQLKDGKYYLYYCSCEGSSPLSTLGVAVADSIEGPYEDKGIFLTSGTKSVTGETFDATEEPNVIDPHVFYDEEDRLWMVYGSYSGGIFILEMDSATGFPKENQGYGKKLLGGNHSRIEAPYILYNKDTEYYYLFLSFGGLDATGGYNIRVARSKNPDGPYEDANGNAMIDAKGEEGSFFDDEAIENYGTKLIGNFEIMNEQDIPVGGYVSPGHNSAYYDEAANKYYIIFHARFPNKGEQNEVRVHQLFFNSDGWPLITPLRYAGESLQPLESEEIAGDYTFYKMDNAIDAEYEEELELTLTASHLAYGQGGGYWKGSELPNESSLVLNFNEYKGYFIRQWDEVKGGETTTFSGMSDEGEVLFGIKTTGD
jgi:arabinan endo-1,5-alpha-L-arabinosidase